MNFDRRLHLAETSGGEWDSPRRSVTPPPVIPAELQANELLTLLRRRLLFLLACVILGGASAFAAGHYLVSYSARALLIVEPTRPDDPKKDQEGPTQEQSTIETFQIMLKSSANLQFTLNRLRELDAANAQGLTLDRLEHHLSIAQELHSRIISITFSSRSAAQAAAVANFVGLAFIQSLQYRAIQDLEQKLGDVRTHMRQLQAAILDRQTSLHASEQDAEIAKVDRELSLARLNEEELAKERDRAVAQPTGSLPIRLLARAVLPERPATGNPVLLIPPGMLIFALAGTLVLVLLDKADRSLRSEQDVKTHLGLSCAGICLARPRGLRLLRPFGRREARYIDLVSARLYAALASKAKGVQIVLVTSALRREGKTSLVATLAKAAVDLGERVIILDVNAAASGKTLRLGLSEVIDGECRLDECIQKGQDGIDRLAGGLWPRLGLLKSSSDLVPRLLAPLRKRYDLILIEGGALLCSNVVQGLAGHADSIVLAVKWRATRRDFVRNAIDEFAGCVPPVAGSPISVVLTEASLRGHARFRFGDRLEAFVRAS